MFKLWYDIPFGICCIQFIRCRILIAKIIAHFKSVVICLQLIPADLLCCIRFAIPTGPLNPDTVCGIRFDDIITAIVCQYAAVRICHASCYISTGPDKIGGLPLIIPQQLSVSRLPDLLVIKRSRAEDTIHLVFQRLHFTVDICPIFFCIRTVSCLHRKLIHPLQHVMHFVERTFCRLNIAYPFRNIIHGLVQAAHLPAHFFGNRQPCRIIRRPVDPVSRRKFFSCLRVSPTAYVQLPICILCQQIMLYKQESLPPP